MSVACALLNRNEIMTGELVPVQNWVCSSLIGAKSVKNLPFPNMGEQMRTLAYQVHQSLLLSFITIGSNQLVNSIYSILIMVFVLFLRTIKYISRKIDYKKVLPITLPWKSIRPFGSF